MKRTKKPHNRKMISKQDVSVQIIEQSKSPSLKAQVSIKSLSHYNFYKTSLVFFEAFNRVSLDRIELGNVKNFDNDQDFEQELNSFKISDKLKIG